MTRSQEIRKGRRTFGDLQQPHGLSVLHLSCRCAFCKADQHNTPGYHGARKYSTRHYICDPCIEKRKDEVLPAVRKHEAFTSRLEALRT
jgi:hypothetical protein